MKKILAFIACFFLQSCSTFLFYPEKTYVSTPESLQIPFENVDIPTTDDLVLRGWLLKAYSLDDGTETEPKGVIVFLHGNAENISTHINGVLWLALEGYHVLAVDYRGFGHSDGEATLSGAQDDAQAMIDYALKRFPDLSVGVFGQSIGGAVALSAINTFADKDKISAVIIDSAFSSTRRIARDKLSSVWLTWPFQYPISWTVAENNPEKHASELSLPKLFLSAQDDPVVPAYHTQRLFESAAEPKELLVLPNVVCHICSTLDKSVRLKVLDFLEQHQKAPF